MSRPPRPPHLDTLAVHAGREERPAEGAVSFPIFMSATYLHSGDGEYDAVRYRRLNNTPNHVQVGAKLATLMGTESAVVTASGMAAIATTLFAQLAAGDHVLAQAGIYGGTHTLLTHDLARFGVTVDFVPHDAPETWATALTPRTKLFYVETVSNPLLRVTDLTAVAAFCRRHGLRSVCDSTFATPVNLRPAALGIDVVVHSATKYMAGHSDVIAGTVGGSAADIAAITQRLNHLGATLDAHSCFLLERGLKTMPLRVRRQTHNATAVASVMAASEDVVAVHYPTLDTTVPAAMQHAMAEHDGSGWGGVLSFVLTGGAARADRFVDALRLVTHAPSLGGVESLITRPATTSHAGLPAAERARLGIVDGLIRLACGIEATEDLVQDLRSALEQSARP